MNERVSGLTVMIVEPEILVRMVLAEYLRDCGYRVLEGSCAEDVFTVLNSDVRVDLVFAEVRLAGETDGFGLARQVRERFAQIEVILTSGAANAADKAGALCEEGVMKKPYHPDELIRRINFLRERRRTSKPP